MRLLPNERQIPYYRRTPVISAEFNPDYRNGDRLIVTDVNGNRGTMSVAAFDATCRLVPGAVVCGIEVSD